MTLPHGEPPAGLWRAISGDELASLVMGAAPERHPRIVAIDGRSASGKSTLAGFLHSAIPGSALVHTDDLAWNEPMFGWGHLLADGILAPLRRGEGVTLRPSAWVRLGRQGAIDVPGTTDVVLVEGVGANQREFADLIDFTIWTQSDQAEAERRGIARDIASGVNGDAEQSAAFWHGWMAHETRFLAEERPWERADLIVAGTDVIPLDTGQFAVAAAPDG